MEPKQPSGFVKWSLIVGIVIVLNMFFNYAISLAYPEPQYPQQTEPQVIGTLYTRDSCIAAGGQWTESQATVAPADPQGKLGGYCDPYYGKRIAYEQAHAAYQRTVFIILAVLGIVCLIAGTVLAHAVIGTALAWGGVLSLLIASMRYWSAADNLVKVLILALALGILIWVALKRFGK